MAALTIWRLEVKSNKYLNLIPHDLNYFRHRFDGRWLPLADWSPPPITIAGKSKKLPDVVGWMMQAPIVSERMKKLLETVAANCVQFLPFHQLRNKDFHVMNVTVVDRELLDVSRSTIFRSESTGWPLGLHKAVFRQVTRELPPLFKVGLEPGQVFGDVFVTQKFVDIAIAHRLTGFELADPGEESLDYVLAGRSQNVVPGIVG